ncbi:hypothetical protein [Yunchengibacter salinarum]|uniref:hypothetical protein n=1 Tax=Yunchengibacter salinarum TaxID=3133399 RepID=UPI0035B5DAD7
MTRQTEIFDRLTRTLNRLAERLSRPATAPAAPGNDRRPRQGRTGDDVDRAGARMEAVFARLASQVKVDFTDLGGTLKGVIGGLADSLKGTLGRLVGDLTRGLTRQVLAGGGLAGGSQGGLLGGGLPALIQTGLGGLLGFAGGGRLSRGVPALVGERGPELVVPDRTSSVVSGADTARFLGRGNLGRGDPVQVVQNISFDLVPGPTVRAMIDNALPGLREQATRGALQALDRGRL